MTTRTRTRGTAAGAALLALALGAGRARGQEVQRLAGDRFAIYNLAGRLEVVAGSGPDVIVRVTRGGADAARLKLESGPIGGRSTLRVIYPSSEIVYSDRDSAAGNRFSSDVRVRPDGTFGGDNGRGSDRVTIRGSGPGLEAWADLRVEVPPGRTVEVREAVGDADVRSVEGKLHLVVGSGRVTAASRAAAIVLVVMVDLIDNLLVGRLSAGAGRCRRRTRRA